MLGLSFLLVSGCGTTAVYGAVEHKSNWNVANDGWDVACLGIKGGDKLTVKTGYCYNDRGRNMAEVRIEYDLIRVIR